MGFLEVSDTLGLGKVASVLVDRLVKDKNLEGRTEAELAMIQAELEKVLVESSQQAMLAQIKVNEQEAKHPSIFVSGWRPAVGWVCVLGLVFNFFVSPGLKWYTAIKHPDIEIPEVDMAQLMFLLSGMLGFGGLRTYEKVRGVQRSSL